MRWEKLQFKSPGLIAQTYADGSTTYVPGHAGPGKRWGHTCNSLLGGKYLYVFGGYGTDDCQTNDINVFDTSKRIWSKPIVNGVPPSPRDSHSCTTVRSSLFVFGGTDGTDPLNDLHTFDTVSNTWTSPSLSGVGPEPREGHSAALVGKRLFIFGGCGKSGVNSTEVYYDDLYILDTGNLKHQVDYKDGSDIYVHCAHDKYPGVVKPPIGIRSVPTEIIYLFIFAGSLTWTRAVTSGTPPSARDSHTCSSWKNKIIVVAGEDASDFYLSDVYILDTDTLVWSELRTSGEIPPPRAGHSTVALGNHLFIFAGFTDDRNLFDDLYMLNVDTGVWTKVMPVGQGPSARFSVAGDAVDLLKGVIAFIGGCNKNLDALDDMYYLHTEMPMENGHGQGQEKLTVRKELKRKCQEQTLSLSAPVNGKEAAKFGTLNGLCRQPVPQLCSTQADKQSSPLFGVNPSQEKIFEAKVMEASDFGYTIETIIDGKRLRGILLSQKTGFTSAAYTCLNGRTTEGVGGVTSPMVKTPAPVQQEAVDHGQANCVQIKALNQCAAETSHASNAKLVDVCQAQMVSEKSETSTTPLSDLRENGANNPTNQRTEGPSEKPKDTDTVASLSNQVSESHEQAQNNRILIK